MKGSRNNTNDTWKGFQVDILTPVLTYWKWLACALFLAFLWIYQIYAADNATGSKECNERLSITRIPLTEDRLREWCRTAGMLKQHLEKGNIIIPIHTLREFIEWGRNNQHVIKNAISNKKVEIFLGVTLSIEHARRNLRKVVEYEMRVEEAERITDNMRGLGDWIPVSSPSTPKLKDWEQADLEVYEKTELTVEAALEELIPDLPLLVPAWHENKEDQEDGVSSISGKEKRRLTWRVINGSSGGPKVRRVK